jgi:hypothetical protein
VLPIGGSHWSEIASIRYLSEFSFFAKLQKSGGFLSQKPKVIPFGLFGKKTDGFMLTTRLSPKA